jgi:hypothetical protein
MPEWPHWWTWEIELSPHLLKRMVDRGFNEVELRAMLQTAGSVRRQPQDEARWVISSQHEGRRWEIVVEPIETDRVLVVITAYAIDG